VPARPAFEKLKPHLEHLDEDQIRTLVRVLDENTNLAPVWNWQTRGPEARAEARRPRSMRYGNGTDGADPADDGSPAP
jgi:hypothetical protein